MTQVKVLYQSNILRHLVRCSAAANAFFSWFDNRAVGARVTKVRVAAEKTGCDYLELVALFRLLEELGFGTFVTGRKGYESRMEWYVNPKTLQNSALQAA